jgi:hypothetical integral membrane protein (TIGR02206 family)
MKSWFNEGDSGFVMFGWEHLLSLCVIFLVVVTMYLLKSRLKKSPAIKFVLVVGLILSEVTYQFWAVYNELWTMKLYLPLQLCSLNILLCIVLLLTENKKLFAFVYLFGFTGAIQGLLTPELYQEPWHFRFVQYFIAHGLIVWTALYFAVIKSYRISLNNFVRSFVWLNVYAAAVYFVNLVIGANYMFLMRKPGSASLLDYLGPHPWYILALEGVAFVLCFVFFLPVREKRMSSTPQDHPPINV